MQDSAAWKWWLAHTFSDLKRVGTAAVIALAAAGCSSDSDGGSSSGGNSSGGSAASGGSSSGGSAGAAAECAEASDCTLFNDCCACVALAPAEPDPASACPEAACIQSHCDAISAPTTPKCLAGRCVLDVNCDLSGITCKRSEPVCDTGSVPTAVGDCYGGCIPLSECATLPAG